MPGWPSPRLPALRYMVVTAKHHDGFALFDSEASDFNSVDATPAGRDFIRELEQACKRGGIDFGVYYSQSIDWRDGGDGGFKSHAPKNPKKKKKRVQFQGMPNFL